MWRKISIAVAAALVSAGLGASLSLAAEDEREQITRTLQDANRALQARNAARFLSHFDRKRFAGYAALEPQIVALTSQADIASSIEVAAMSGEGGGYRVRIDWILQLTLLSAPSEVKRRQTIVDLRVDKQKKRWRVVELEPVEFFRAY